MKGFEQPEDDGLKPMTVGATYPMSGDAARTIARARGLPHGSLLPPMAFVLALVAIAGALVAAPLADTKLERGKRLVDEAVKALGGDRFLNVRDREENGQAYSFYREEVTGRSVAKFYTRYLPTVQDTANTLAIEQRQYFGKRQETSVLLNQNEGWELTFRGARPLATERFVRYKETTLRDILYIMRIRLHEPGMTFEWRGADVFDNRPVEIVDVTDAQNRVTTVYFDQTTKLPIRQVFYRRDPATKEKDEEITQYTKYRDVQGVQWPFDIHRERNGEKIYEMFCDSAEVNKSPADDRFQLPSSVKLLKKV